MDEIIERVKGLVDYCVDMGDEWYKIAITNILQQDVEDVEKEDIEAIAAYAIEWLMEKEETANRQSPEEIEIAKLKSEIAHLKHELEVSNAARDGFKAVAMAKAKKK
jgi:hypothetical protein